MARSESGLELKETRSLFNKPFSLEDKQRYVEAYNFPSCNDIAKYKVMVKIGYGAFGEIFKAREAKTTKLVILKRILPSNEFGLPTSALREIRLLQKLKHENIVNLIEICCSKPTMLNGYKSSTYLVLEYCQHDLASLLSNININFSHGEIKGVMQQLLKALSFIHGNDIVHQDLKTSNILFTEEGVLKLADFSSAHSFRIFYEEVKNRCTNSVVSLGYHPPELLLEEQYYGTSVDMWGVGCIMAEMWTRFPIFQGQTKAEQLESIEKLCGSITPEDWTFMGNDELNDSTEMSDNPKGELKYCLLPYIKDLFAFDLLEKLLILDPKKRIDAFEALSHDFFLVDPRPEDLRNVMEEQSRSTFNYLVRSSHSELQCDQQKLIQVNEELENSSCMDQE